VLRQFDRFLDSLGFVIGYLMAWAVLLVFVVLFITWCLWIFNVYHEKGLRECGGALFRSFLVFLFFGGWVPIAMLLID
jgi:hypothetical protein